MRSSLLKTTDCLPVPARHAQVARNWDDTRSSSDTRTDVVKDVQRAKKKKCLQSLRNYCRGNLSVNAYHLRIVWLSFPIVSGL